MSIPTTYAELKTEIANWLNRSDLTDDIETFIKFGEVSINRVSRLSQQETTTAVVTTSGQNYTSLPTGFIEGISLTFDDDLYSDPEKIDISELDKNSIQTSSGTPQYYAISDEKYYWNQKPDAAYNLTARYYKKWDIATDTTNWLLTNNPDIYLYASLSQAGKFIKHPDRSEWMGEAERILSELEYQSIKQKKAPLTVDAALMSASGTNSNIFQGF